MVIDSLDEWRWKSWNNTTKKTKEKEQAPLLLRVGDGIAKGTKKGELNSPFFKI
jgi:hypothetical protein